MTSILIGVLLSVHIIVCIFLILIVLMQRPRSEGLGTAFGGGMTDTLFGSGAGNVLTKITTWLGIIFFATTILLAYLYSRRDTASKLGSKLRDISATVTNVAPTSGSVPQKNTSSPTTSTNKSP